MTSRRPANRSLEAPLPAPGSSRGGPWWLMSVLALAGSCADGPEHLGPPVSASELGERQLPYGPQGDETDPGDSGQEPQARIPTDEELVARLEREAWERAVAASPVIAERVAEARAGLVPSSDTPFVLEPREPEPELEGLCSTDRLPVDVDARPLPEQRVIPSSRRHREDVDHLIRAAARAPGDRVSPESLRALIGQDGTWHPQH